MPTTSSAQEPAPKPERTADARAPKRQRGHLRVAAIMMAGADIFAEKGYDGATMTEIAARSATAIGSLYRFFPSKDALADALLRDYAQHALDGLAALAERAADLTPEDLAGALVEFRRGLQSQRRLAVALADSQGGSGDKRVRFRTAALDGLATILRRAIPGLTPEKAASMAMVLLHVLKAVSAAAQEPPPGDSLLLTEIREMICLYLAAAQRAAAGQP